MKKIIILAVLVLIAALYFFLPAKVEAPKTEAATETSAEAAKPATQEVK